jgi:hypothetical protein
MHVAFSDDVASRGKIVLATMYFADEATKRYPSQGSTMRAMPFPDKAPEKFIKLHNLFYSVCQIYATLEILARPSMSYAFMVLFPIQMAAFLMTCIRKGIITASGWHLWYTCALLTTLLYSVSNTEVSFNLREIMVYHVSAIMFAIGRFIIKLDKYVLWTCIIGVVQMSFINPQNPCCLPIPVPPTIGLA